MLTKRVPLRPTVSRISVSKFFPFAEVNNNCLANSTPYTREGSLLGLHLCEHIGQHYLNG
jgi:hypothetical protein